MTFICIDLSSAFFKILKVAVETNLEQSYQIADDVQQDLRRSFEAKATKLQADYDSCALEVQELKQALLVEGQQVVAHKAAFEEQVFYLSVYQSSRLVRCGS